MAHHLPHRTADRRRLRRRRRRGREGAQPGHRRAAGRRCPRPRPSRSTRPCRPRTAPSTAGARPRRRSARACCSSWPTRSSRAASSSRAWKVAELRQAATRARSATRCRRSSTASATSPARRAACSGTVADEYLAGHTSMIRRDPIGVVGSIAPWNYPLMMAAWKIAPALAAGNTVVIKPSRADAADHAAARARWLAEIFPKGVLNVVTGRGATRGPAAGRAPEGAHGQR